MAQKCLRQRTVGANRAQRPRAESAADLRRPGESQLDYLKRVSTQQDARLAEGGDAIVGNYVLIEHDGGESSVYAHLKTGSARVKPTSACARVR